MARFKWVVEFEVDETWVANGFNLTEERANEMLAHEVQYAHGYEIHAKVIKSPSPDRIAKKQGYRDAGDPAFKND